MEPPGSQLDCHFGRSTYTDYAGCHRYDQSALSVLVAAANDYDDKKYFRDKPNAAIRISRAP